MNILAKKKIAADNKVAAKKKALSKKKLASKKVASKKVAAKKKATTVKTTTPVPVNERVKRHRAGLARLGFRTRSFVVHEDDVEQFVKLEKRLKVKRKLKQSLEQLGD